MKKSFSKLFLAPLTVLVLASFALAPVAEALGGAGARAGGGGGGGGAARAGGGGGDRAGAGGGARAGAGGGGGRQIDSSQTDVRANNVRNSSVNNVNSNRNVNVNANRNVNVNVDNQGGCCGGGWDNDYHPVARAAAVTGAVAVTSAVTGQLRPGQLRRHGLSAVRQYLVSAAGRPVRGDQPALLRGLSMIEQGACPNLANTSFPPVRN
jgi:hypothetical protein